MSALLTHSQLHTHILSLKDTIDDYDRHHRCKLLFFNARCFYDHVTRLPEVCRLLDSLEPFIPVSLCAESLEMFIQSALKQDEMETCADFLMLNARVDFVASLHNANSPECWSRLVGLCETIRDIKEELGAGLVQLTASPLQI